MPQLVVKIPESLREEKGRIENEISELISSEKKRKVVSMFIDDVMKGAGQLKEDELVELGRQFKKGRFEKLKAKRLV